MRGELEGIPGECRLESEEDEDDESERELGNIQGPVIPLALKTVMGRALHGSLGEAIQNKMKQVLPLCNVAIPFHTERCLGTGDTK